MIRTKTVVPRGLSDIVTNIGFKTIVPSIKNFFHQRKGDFVNKLNFNNHKYQTNETIINESYKETFLFTMKVFCCLEHILSQCFLCQPDS